MARCREPYCMVRFSTGSKKRCMYSANATSTPTSIALSSAREPPNTMTSASANADRNSTDGNRTACIRTAARFAPRFSEFASPNERMFALSRFMLWITRTPEMFSWRLPLTTEIALRARMNARRANLCHIAIIRTSTGMTDSVMAARPAFISIIAVMIPTRLSTSAIVMTTIDMNSCSWLTSFWTLDITLPVSFLL